MAAALSQYHRSLKVDQQLTRRDVIFLVCHCELCLKTHTLVRVAQHTQQTPPLFANPAACVSIEQSENVYTLKIHSNPQRGSAFYLVTTHNTSLDLYKSQADPDWIRVQGF